MTLMHYAAEEFAFDRARVYDQRKPRGYGKPVGFWVSVVGEDDWAAWCSSEDFGIGGFAHDVTLTEGTNVLYIDTAHGIDAFHENHSVETDFERDHRFDKKEWPIDWPTVAKLYDGIVIAPYQWSRRLDGPSWYYGWDCASGCIWNLDAIAGVELCQEVSR